MPAEPIAGRSATPDDAGAVCGICQNVVRAAEAVGGCPACDALAHVECWDEYGGCAVYGCRLAPESIHDTASTGPAAVWGVTERACPACGQTIKAAALRCRHCGEALTAEGSGAPGPGIAAGPSRAAMIALLVAGIVPFTSPVVLLVGGPWLFLRRGAMRRWPPTTRAVTLMAVVAGGAVTLVALAAMAIQARAGAGVAG